MHLECKDCLNIPIILRCYIWRTKAVSQSVKFMPQSPEEWTFQQIHSSFKQSNTKTKYKSYTTDSIDLS